MSMYLIAYKCWLDMGWGEKSGVKTDAVTYSFPDDYKFTTKNIEEIRKSIEESEKANGYANSLAPGIYFELKILAITKIDEE